MHRLVPWDVWLAVALAIAVAIVGVFGAGLPLLAAMFFALCGYVVIEAFSSERRD